MVGLQRHPQRPLYISISYRPSCWLNDRNRLCGESLHKGGEVGFRGQYPPQTPRSLRVREVSCRPCNLLTFQPSKSQRFISIHIILFCPSSIPPPNMRSCGFFHFFSDYIAKKTYARIPTTRHPDHEYIVARHDRYIEAYNSRSVERMMEFMDEEDFVYSDFGEKNTASFCAPLRSHMRACCCSGIHLVANMRRWSTRRNVLFHCRGSIRAYIFQFSRSRDSHGFPAWTQTIYCVGVGNHHQAGAGRGWSAIGRGGSHADEADWVHADVVER